MASNEPTYEELRQQLNEEKQKRRDAEQQRRDEEQKRRDEEQKRRDEEQKRLRAEAELRGRETQRSLSFYESLRVWHEVYAGPKVYFPPGPRKYTSGLTSPRNRFYPARLCAWTAFDRLQQDALDRLVRANASPDDRRFPPVQRYEGEREFMSDLELVDEVDLVLYAQRAVEEWVAQTYHLMGSTKIGFRRRADHSLEAEHVAERLSHLRASKVSDTLPATPQKTRRIDKIGFVKEDDGTKRDIMVIEYKAAHKLTPELCSRGLRPMELAQVINRAKIPTDPQKKDEELAELAVASVITQLFDYMVDKCVCYGYVTGGQAYIFLYFHPDDPNTLFYHSSTLSMPPSAEDFSYRETAVALVASFVMLAREGPQLDLQWYRDKRKTLARWTVCEEKLMAQVTPMTVPSTKPSPAFIGPNTSDETRSPYQTRLRAKLAGCREEQPAPQRDSSDNDDDDDGNDANYGSPTKLPGQQRNLRVPTKPDRPPRQGPDRGQNSSQDDGGRSRRFCTQECLLTLVRGGLLDPKCPNFCAHQQGSRDKHHPIDERALLESLAVQLYEDEDNGFESMERSGWSGALFWVRVDPYDYTFVGKGTIRELAEALQHEACLYRHMESIQGRAIPVLLGSLDLRRPHRLRGVEVWIEHVMLMSWAGEGARECRLEERRLQRELARTVKDVKRLGVHQGDLRWPNVLWNEELGRVMLIDFEFGWLEGTTKPVGEIAAQIAVDVDDDETSTNPSPKRQRIEESQREAGSKRIRAPLKEIEPIPNWQRPAKTISDVKPSHSDLLHER